MLTISLQKLFWFIRRSPDLGNWDDAYDLINEEVIEQEDDVKT